MQRASPYPNYHWYSLHLAVWDGQAELT